MAVSNPDWALVIQAICFAAQKHRDQRRTDAHASPFINHLIDSVDLAIRVGRVTDMPVLLAVALHDMLANTSTTAAEIERRFGSDVRRLVEDVSDAPRLPEAERRKRRLAWAKTASARARLVRLATMTAALSALPAHKTAAERREYLEWMSTLGEAVGGTNAPLAALFAERLRQEFLRPFTPTLPTLALPRPPAVRGNRSQARRIVRKAERAAEFLDRLAVELERILRGETIREGPAPVPEEHKPRGKARPVRFPDEPWKRLAARGVRSINFTPHTRAAAFVAIDGEEPFTLLLAQAHLLEVLSSAPLAADGFAAFQSYAAIAEHLSRIEGRHVSVHAVDMRISRLREQLHKATGRSPLLVETAPGELARFRVRQPLVSPHAVH